MSKFGYIPDKCNPPPIDMGHAIIFADAMPGMNDTVVRPFGWSEYDSAYRHQYIPDPKGARRPCVDRCRPKGTERKPPPKEYVDPRRCSNRPGICNLCHMAKCRCPISPPWDHRKEKVMVYDPDSVRSLLVRGELRNEHPFVLSCSHYADLLANAAHRTKEDREAELNESLRLQELARMECKEKADELRLIDEHRWKDAMSPEARQDMEEIICRSQFILKEDEPEVRTINKVILAAKVQAIREAQLAERELIRCEQKEEERRVLAVIAQDKAHALIPDDEQEVELVEKKKKELMAAITLQLQQHEANKFLEKEMLEAERAGMRRAWEAADLKEMQANALLVEKKHRLGVELLDDQMFHLSLQKAAKEFEKAEDQKVVEWQRKKAAEDEAHEKERLAQKRLKDMAIGQVLATQKRTSDDRILRDEMRAKRHVEYQEREWRRKERDAALKKEADSMALKEGILNQMAARQQFFVEQAALEKGIYDQIYSVQDEQQEEERRKEDERRLRNARYRYDIREQIHTCQVRSVKERKDHFVEGINMRRNLGQREQEIRCVMEAKLESLKDSNLPEKYLNYIRKAVAEELKPEWQKSMSKK